MCTLSTGQSRNCVLLAVLCYCSMWPEEALAHRHRREESSKASCFLVTGTRRKREKEQSWLRITSKGEKTWMSGEATSLPLRGSFSLKILILERKLSNFVEFGERKKIVLHSLRRWLLHKDIWTHYKILYLKLLLEE